MRGRGLPCRCWRGRGHPAADGRSSLVGGKRYRRLGTHAAPLADGTATDRGGGALSPLTSARILILLTRHRGGAAAGRVGVNVGFTAPGVGQPRPVAGPRPSVADTLRSTRQRAVLVLDLSGLGQRLCGRGLERSGRSLRLRESRAALIGWLSGRGHRLVESRAVLITRLSGWSLSLRGRDLRLIKPGAVLIHPLSGRGLGLRGRDLGLVEPGAVLVVSLGGRSLRLGESGAVLKGGFGFGCSGSVEPGGRLGRGQT